MIAGVDLEAQARRLAAVSLSELIASDPARAQDFALRVGSVYANFARQRYDRAALDALFTTAERCDLAGAVRRLLDGEHVNITEQRAALHCALRGACSDAPAARDARAHAVAAQVRMGELVRALSETDVTDIISVGIGGSDLGPRLVVDALSKASARFRVHFISNVDGHAAQRVLARLDPSRCAAIVISKSFTTQDTLLNGERVRAWLNDDSRLYAVSANAEQVAAFGIPEARRLPMWDWVGGRYSLWSAVGFPIALALGMPNFEALLRGAAQMDTHVATAPLRSNLPVWHALTAVWNRNALHAATQAVMPYDDRLKLLPDYLQQLVMESLGKATRIDGVTSAVDTVPVWWGGAGTDTQHSFFQALHQGTQMVPADFIGVCHPDHAHSQQHAVLLANLLAQSEALCNGQAAADPHRCYPGDRPSTMLLLDALTPEALGALIALYEHSVYLQSVLWGINAFDQFGVELGKHIANDLLPSVLGDSETRDSVTRALLAELHRVR